MSDIAKNHIAGVVDLIRTATQKINHRFLMEELLMGREAHQALHQKRERLWSLERDEYFLREKFGALGIPETHPLFKEKLDELHAASASLDGDIRAEVEAANTAIAQRIEDYEKNNNNIETH